jgi:hypothetical protein
MPIGNAEQVTRNCLRDIAQQIQNWLKKLLREMGRPCFGYTGGRRDDFVDELKTTEKRFFKTKNEHWIFDS